MSLYRELLDAIERDRLREFTKRAIREIGLRPSKRLGQNFTVDKRILEEILSRVSRLGCEDPVADIGAGLGVVSLYLSRVCRRVYAVERDKRLCQFLDKISGEVPGIEVVCRDALDFLEDTYVAGVAGTIPYSITGPLLGRLSLSRCRWAVVALQKDVVDRIMSRPGSRRYGSVSVLIETYFETETGGVYPPESFYPEPEVYTQIVVLRKREGVEVLGPGFQRFIKCLFSQRRRLLSKALEKCLSIDTETLAPRDLLSKRVFQLAPREIEALYRALSQKT